jgi:uncharacterized protein Yka (UPF0111/DUF47 family)
MNNHNHNTADAADTADTIDDLRQRMEERKRLNLTEGRMLMQRLDDAATEIARLRENLMEVQQQQAAPAEQATSQHNTETLGSLLSQSASAAATSDPLSISGAVYAWCNDWLNVRAKLMKVIATEQQVIDEIQRLEQEADQMSQRIATLLQEKG